MAQVLALGSISQSGSWSAHYQGKGVIEAEKQLRMGLRLES